MTFEGDDDAVISVTSTVDVEGARRTIRNFCLAAGLSPNRTEEMVVATSELATNLVRYSSVGGTVAYRLIEVPRRGIEIETKDSGPGISDLASAEKDGFSTTRKSLGGGLSSARSLVDEFLIESQPGSTWIRMRKWLP